MHCFWDKEGVSTRTQRVVGVAKTLEHFGATFDVSDVHVGELSLRYSSWTGSVDAEEHVFFGAGWEERFGLAELFV